jgi:hypothetical protein
MDKDFDLEIDELRKEVAEDLRGNQRNRSVNRPGFTAGFRPERGSLLLAVIGILAVILAIVLFLGRGDRIPEEDLRAMAAKISDLEKKLAKVEAVEEKMAALETRVRKLQRSVSKGFGPVASRSQAARYHEVRQGETLSGIAKKYDITVQDLCRLNKVTPKSIIRPGQKLLVSSGG